MQKAYALAKQAKSTGEVPVGAVLVSNENQLLSEGFNQCIRLSDATAHAEILAVREACKKLNNYRLSDTTLYVTLEPCAMCAGALIQARIKRVVFAARDIQRGACGSLLNLLGNTKLNHQVIIDEGLMAEASAELLREFFEQRR